MFDAWIRRKRNVSEHIAERCGLQRAYGSLVLMPSRAVVDPAKADAAFVAVLAGTGLELVERLRASTSRESTAKLYSRKLTSAQAESAAVFAAHALGHLANAPHLQPNEWRAKSLAALRAALPLSAAQEAQLVRADSWDATPLPVLPPLTLEVLALACGDEQLAFPGVIDLKDFGTPGFLMESAHVFKDWTAGVNRWLTVADPEFRARL